MDSQTEGLVFLWNWFGRGACRGYSPVYGRICETVATTPELIDLVKEAPANAHLPPSLLAAVHDILLREPQQPLAAVYSGASDADPGPLFASLCRVRRAEVVALMAARQIQTNECGRSALIGAALTHVAAETNRPLALVDVGTSAGLNLICDRYRLEYGTFGATGPADSPVRIECEVKGGDPPIAAELPEVVTRIGIDRAPIDLSDPDDSRWLLACVWPGTGRLERTAAAIELGRAHRPPILTGDANDLLPAVLADLPADATAVVLTTWVFSYFSVEDRARFVDILQDASLRRPVAWVSGDAIGTVPSLDAPTGEPGASEPSEGTPGARDAGEPGEEGAGATDRLGLCRFDQGECIPVVLATVQSHGAWMNWHVPNALCRR